MNPLPQFKRNLRSVSSLRISIPGAVYRIVWLVASITMPGSIATAQVQTVSADFGGRSNSTPLVPSGFFAVGGTGDSLIDPDGISMLTSAGLTGTRFWISLQEIYGTSTPSFRYLDARMRRISASGLHPIGVIYDTPSSLGPSTCAPPSDISQWGEMAATVVAHVDQKFPGVLQDYEIWNEPEIDTSLCISDDSTRLNTYVSMFAAAASAMHAQAQADGETIRTGGPVIAHAGQAPVWISALLNNELTAPYVDFVSFHLYLSGQNDIDSGMTWSTLYSYSQSADGLAARYTYIEPFVRAGHQPNAASTPIYVSEFNDNWAFSADCCRNDPAYGPLWNSLAITDFLNVVYTGATAVPSRVVYYNAAGNYFCLLGYWNADMDCNQSQMDPYPQYYTYQLFASPSYLDLQNGGHMAVSVSPSSTTSGLSATAFYTDGADNVVIVNPTSTSYDAVEVNLANPGLTLVAGTQYLLNADNAQISLQSATLTPISEDIRPPLQFPRTQRWLFRLQVLKWERLRQQR
jgi:Glycosyl hydrolases family 39